MRRRPATAAANSSKAGTASSPADVATCVALPVACWSEHHHSHHKTQHPHLQHDLMSTMRFSRPRSAPQGPTMQRQMHTAAVLHGTMTGELDADSSDSRVASAHSHNSSAHQQTAVQHCQDKGSAGDADDASKLGGSYSNAGDAVQHTGSSDELNDGVSAVPKTLADQAALSPVQTASVECVPDSSKAGLDEGLEAMRQMTESSVNRQQSSEGPLTEHRPGVNGQHFGEESLARQQSGETYRSMCNERSGDKQQSSWQEQNRDRQSRGRDRQQDIAKGGQQCLSAEGARWRLAAVHRLHSGAAHCPTAKVSELLMFQLVLRRAM